MSGDIGTVIWDDLEMELRRAAETKPVDVHTMVVVGECGPSCHLFGGEWLRSFPYKPMKAQAYMVLDGFHDPKP